VTAHTSASVSAATGQLGVARAVMPSASTIPSGPDP
jgi:hypothetical protein